MTPNLYAHSGESNLADPLFVWTLDGSVVVITIIYLFLFSRSYQIQTQAK